MTKNELKNFLDNLGQKYVNKIRKDPQGLAGIYLDYLSETANWPEEFEEIKIEMWVNIEGCAFFGSIEK